MRKASRDGSMVAASIRFMPLTGIASAILFPYHVLAGAAGPSQTGQQVYVDDYITIGGPVTSYAVDGSDSTALTENLITTAANSIQIRLSGDGSALVFDGYNAVVGTASEYTSPYLTRSVGIVSGSGSIDTTTQFLGTTGTPVPNALWLGGSNPILTAAGKYSVTKDTQTSTAPTSYITGITPSVGNYFGGNLYVLSTSSGHLGINEVTNNGTTATQLPGLPTSGAPATYADFVMADPDATNPYGFDTFYLAVTGNATAANPLGLEKWTYSGGASGTYSLAWTLGSTAATMGFAADPTNTFVKSLTMTTDGNGNNILYGIAVDAVGKGTSPNVYDDTYLVELTDHDSSTTVGTDSFTELAASTPLEEFGGVAFAPTGTGFGTGDLAVLQVGGSAVPEPTSLSLLGIAAMSLLGRRTKARA